MFSVGLFFKKNAYLFALLDKLGLFLVDVAFEDLTQIAALDLVQGFQNAFTQK